MQFGHCFFTGLCLLLNAHGLQVSQTERLGSAARPNILFLMTDSLDGRLLDPTAPEYNVVSLPFLDGVLSKGGANFARSYSNNPFCVPSRSSMMSGRRSDSIMVYGNDFGLAASPQGIPDDSCISTRSENWCNKFAAQQRVTEIIPTALRKLGYNVHLSGKLHFGAGLMNRKTHADSFEGLKTKPAFGKPVQGIIFQSLSDFEVAGHKQFNPKATTTDGTNPNGRLDDKTVSDCTNFISTLPRQSEASEQPFFLYCSFNLPHYPYITNATWIHSGVHEDKIWVPKLLDGGIDKYHPYDKFLIYSKGINGNFPDWYITRLRKVYYAMAVEADAMMHRVWHQLTEKGYNLDNTYVLHVSDHGEMAWDHHQIRKSSLYEGSVRVPIQIAGPGITKGLQVKSHLTSLLDIFPTLLDIAQETDWTGHSGLMGHSLLEVAGGSSHAPENLRLPRHTDTRNGVISQYKWLGSSAGSYMLRSGPWKLITFGRTFSNSTELPPLLFNVEDDPLELRNLAGDAGDVVSQLMAKLNAQMNVDAVDMKISMLQFAGLMSRYGNKPQALTEFVAFTYKGYEARAAELLTSAMDLWTQPGNADLRQLTELAAVHVALRNKDLLEIGERFDTAEDDDDDFMDSMLPLAE